MAKVKYRAAENTKVGTHSFYAIPQPAGTLTMDELLEEALDGKSIEPSVARAAITEYMRAVQRNVLKGFRCQLGVEFLTVYPNLSASVKDQLDSQGNVVRAATADMLNAAAGKSRLGCTVSSKFSQKFAAEVSWQKIDQAGNAAPDADEDINDENPANNPVTGGGTAENDPDGELEP